MAELRSQGVEVAGEDYLTNRKKEWIDAAKGELTERLEKVISELSERCRDTFPVAEIWGMIEKIAQKEVKK